MKTAPKYKPNSFFFTDVAATTHSVAQTFGPFSKIKRIIFKTCSGNNGFKRNILMTVK